MKSKKQEICECGHEKKEHHFCSDYPECPLLGVCEYSFCPCKKFKSESYKYINSFPKDKYKFEPIIENILKAHKKFPKNYKFKPQSPEGNSTRKVLNGENGEYPKTSVGASPTRDNQSHQATDVSGRSIDDAPVPQDVKIGTAKTGLPEEQLRGCGKFIEDSGFACGEVIGEETKYEDDDREYGSLVLCSSCQVKEQKK